MRVVLVSALVLLAGVSGAAGAGRGRLALAQADPVVVAGSGFAPGHAVAVSYASGATRVRRIARTGAQGRFRVTFAGLRFVRCRGASVRATGAEALVVLPCSAPGGKPTLLGDLAGFVEGSAFVPGEHVKLMARASDRAPVTGAADAAADGSFAAHLPLTGLRCGDLFFSAAGSLGSAATFTVAGPDCKSP